MESVGEWVENSSKYVMQLLWLLLSYETGCESSEQSELHEVRDVLCFM